MDEQNMESHCRAKISPDFKRRSLDIENIIRPSLKAFEIRLGCYFEKGFRAIRARDGRRYSAEQRANGIDAVRVAAGRHASAPRQAASAVRGSRI